MLFTGVTLGVLHNLREIPIFIIHCFLHPQTGDKKDLIDSLVIYLSICCILNALWKEMKYRWINIVNNPSTFISGYHLSAHFCTLILVVNLWQVWSQIQEALERNREHMLPCLSVQWKDHYPLTWRPTTWLAGCRHWAPHLFYFLKEFKEAVGWGAKVSQRRLHFHPGLEYE